MHIVIKKSGCLVFYNEAYAENRCGTNDFYTYGEFYTDAKRVYKIIGVYSCVMPTIVYSHLTTFENDEDYKTIHFLIKIRPLFLAVRQN